MRTDGHQPSGRNVCVRNITWALFGTLTVSNGYGCRLLILGRADFYMSAVHDHQHPLDVKLSDYSAYPSVQYTVLHNMLPDHTTDSFGSAGQRRQQIARAERRASLELEEPLALGQAQVARRRFLAKPHKRLERQPEPQGLGSPGRGGGASKTRWCRCSWFARVENNTQVPQFPRRLVLHLQRPDERRARRVVAAKPTDV